MFCTFVVLAAVASALGSDTEPSARIPIVGIVGGEDAAIEMFPYQVAVYYNNEFTCGGSIISPYVVLTAAHCVFDSVEYYSIIYGQTNLVTDISTTVSVSSAKTHPYYNATTFDYDVAIFRLKSAVPYSAASKSIPLATISPEPDTTAVVTGWGTTSEDGIPSSILQKVSVPIVDREVCKQQYVDVNPITERMLCAGVSAGGKDSCQGDSGGPLVVNGILVGIVSWGLGCARPGFAGVYTDVASVRSWIVAYLTPY